MRPRYCLSTGFDLRPSIRSSGVCQCGPTHLIYTQYRAFRVTGTRRRREHRMREEIVEGENRPLWQQQAVAAQGNIRFKATDRYRNLTSELGKRPREPAFYPNGGFGIYARIDHASTTKLHQLASKCCSSTRGKGASEDSHPSHIYIPMLLQLPDDPAYQKLYEVILSGFARTTRSFAAVIGAPCYEHLSDDDEQSVQVGFELITQAYKKTIKDLVFRMNSRLASMSPKDARGEPLSVGDVKERLQVMSSDPQLKPIYLVRCNDEKGFIKAKQRQSQYNLLKTDKSKFWKKLLPRIGCGYDAFHHLRPQDPKAKADMETLTKVLHRPWFPRATSTLLIECSPWVRIDGLTLVYPSVNDQAAELTTSTYLYNDNGEVREDLPQILFRRYTEPEFQETYQHHLDFTPPKQKKLSCPRSQAN